MTAPWLQAQDVLVTLEAEKGIITLPAKVKPVDGSTVEGISGGKYVGDNDPGSSIVFNDVEVPEAGTYEFKTYYMSIGLLPLKSITIPNTYRRSPIRHRVGTYLPQTK